MTREINVISLLMVVLILGCNKTPIHPPELAPIAIIPQPQKVVPDNGYFTVNHRTTIGVETEEQKLIADHFVERFFKASGWAPEVKLNTSSSQITLNHFFARFHVALKREA